MCWGVCGLRKGARKSEVNTSRVSLQQQEALCRAAGGCREQRALQDRLQVPGSMGVGAWGIAGQPYTAEPRVQDWHAAGQGGHVWPPCRQTRQHPISMSISCFQCLPSTKKQAKHSGPIKGREVVLCQTVRPSVKYHPCEAKLAVINH